MNLDTLEADFPRLMHEAGVPGIAAAIVRDARVKQYLCFGSCGVRIPARVDENTIFDAASLSKPVFACLVSQQVRRGQLALDVPLSHYLPNYLPGDTRASSITAAHVLSHSSGLPNWRNADIPLRTYFSPGDWFSYSGEGFLFLQRVVEAVTGEPLDTLARRLIFDPLGMARSGFVWRQDMRENRAWPHDAFGNEALGHKPGEANAAWSLQTSAADYARFLCATLSGDPVTAAAWGTWFAPYIDVRHAGTQCLEPATDIATGISWSLGWGLETAVGTFFHWGDNGPFTAFTIGSVSGRTAFVAFANGASGLAILPDLVAPFFPGTRSCFSWLDYTRHDAPVRRLLRASWADGIQSIWTEIEAAALSAEELRWIAQGLGAHGMSDDQAWLRGRINT
jgi:CubicO group peptidase (beta-lactamase class C family)